MIKRRMFLASGAAALAMPAVARAESERVLTLRPASRSGDARSDLDHRHRHSNHGFLVFDTLFGLDETFKPSPQMAEGASAEADDKTWTITLRVGSACSMTRRRCSHATASPACSGGASATPSARR